MNHEKIAIVVDSGCDVPKEWLKKDLIFEIPLQITIDDRCYRDRKEITTEEIYKQMSLGKVPKTSLPQGKDIQNLFDHLQSQGYTHVLVCTISSQLSGTYQLIQLLSSEQESMHIHVFDTKSISIGAGLFALHAAMLVEQGWQFDSIIKEVCHPSRSHVFGEVETLEYLKRGGRISHLSATLGSVLNIKPLLTISDDGCVMTMAKVKGRRRMFRLFCQEVEKVLDAPKKYIIAIEGNDDLTADLDGVLEQYPELIDTIRSHVGAAFGVHVGPKVTVMAIYRMYD